MAEIRRWETKQDGIENLYFTSAPMPEISEEHVLVKVSAVSLNYRDTEVAMGLYGHHKSLSESNTTVPCSDMCGTIVTSKSSQWKEGQRVMSIFNQSHQTGQIKVHHMSSGLGYPLPGVLTEYRSFPANGLVAVPEYMTDEEASCLPIASVTAWMALNGMRPIGELTSSEDTVLIQGTGGVAIAGLQLANALGLKTIITSSLDAKLEKAKKLGATHTINYHTTPNWHDEVMRLTENEGADIIFETGGAQTLRKSFDAIAFGGLINSIGYLSGKEDEPGDRTNMNVLALRRNVTLKGLLNGPKDRFEEMSRFYEQHQIHPIIDKVFDFEEAKEALQYLYSGGHFGKVIVKVSS